MGQNEEPGTAEHILAISADAIVSTDAAQKIIRFNRGAEEIFGYAAAEVMGQPLEILLPERFRSDHASHVQEFGRGPIAARRMGERGQISGLRRNGEEFPAEASISRIMVSGELIYTAVLRDVTERMRIEQTQRFLARAGALLAGSLDSERTLETVADLAVPVLGDWCVVFVGGSGKPFRRAFCHHADPSRAELMRRLCTIPVQMTDAHPAYAALVEGRSVANDALDEASLHAIAGSEMHLEVVSALRPRSMIAVPLIVRDSVIGGIAIFRERGGIDTLGPESMQLAEELARRAALALDNARLFSEAQAAVHARDDVLAVVSHDLGNPLAAIRLSAAVLMRSVDDEDARRQAENIRFAVDQMQRLIQDLLEIKRIEAGYLSLETQRLEASLLLARATEAHQGLIEERQQRLVRRDGPPALVLADPERMAQVFSNLIGNAAKFTPAGGQIEVGAEVRNDVVIFSVRDDGPGIPAEHLPHVFDRFWQARRTGRHGVGLGLAIVRGIVDAHGGRVWAESEPGAGSTFYVELARA